MEEKLKNLSLFDKNDINILLLGETGVGKSTFINSIANYLQFHDLENALTGSLLYLIPCMFNITDENFQTHRIMIGSDANEYQLQVGDSATQDVQTYVFPLGNGKTRLRFIDTPGMGDPIGTDQDDTNCENILSYIGQLNYLHAICFLFKPNESRITVTFEYCMKQILSRLEKSAAENIIFIFTNAKETNYKPGETFTCLRKIFGDIKKRTASVNIKVQNNVFCFDNEAFRYLAAVKQGLAFENTTKREYLKSWQNSSKEAWKLIKYIVGDVGCPALTPHFVKQSTSINEARRIINQLAQPLADISQLIMDNLRILERREKDLKANNSSLQGLKSKLYVPIINLKVIKLTQPTTVCCNEKCAELIPVDGIKTWNYKQRCHDPCYLRNVPEDIVGAPQLKDCAAMNKGTQTCLKCGCHQCVHMHIYYMTEKFDDKKVDSDVLNRISTTEAALAEAERVTVNIRKRKNELEEEKEVIIAVAAKFSLFLQQNANTPFNDAYRKYIDYMIVRERALGVNADRQIIDHLEKLLRRYDQVQSTFDKILSLAAQVEDESREIGATDISALLPKLYSLKHNGKTIKELFRSQNSSRANEFKKTEYIHQSAVKKPEENVTRHGKLENSDSEGEKMQKDSKNNQNKNVAHQTNNQRTKSYVNSKKHTVTVPNEQIKIEITKVNAPPIKLPSTYSTNNYRKQGTPPQNSQTDPRNRPQNSQNQHPVSYNQNQSYNRRPNDFQEQYDDRRPYDYDRRAYERPPQNYRPQYDYPVDRMYPHPPQMDYPPPYEYRPPYDSNQPREFRPPYKPFHGPHPQHRFDRGYDSDVNQSPRYYYPQHYEPRDNSNARDNRNYGYFPPAYNNSTSHRQDNENVSRNNGNPRFHRSRSRPNL